MPVDHGRGRAVVVQLPLHVAVERRAVVPVQHVLDQFLDDGLVAGRPGQRRLRGGRFAVQLLDGGRQLRAGHAGTGKFPRRRSLRTHVRVGRRVDVGVRVVRAVNRRRGHRHGVPVLAAGRQTPLGVAPVADRDVGDPGVWGGLGWRIKHISNLCATCPGQEPAGNEFYSYGMVWRRPGGRGSGDELARI